MKDTIIIGGDERQKCLCDILSDRGIRCVHIDKEEKRMLINEADKWKNIILPVPVSKDKEYIYSNDKHLKIRFDEIFDIAADDALVSGGNFSREEKEKMIEKKLNYFDFYMTEEFAVSNAFLTAQGALRELLVHTKKHVVSSRVMITGFGRVAKALAGLLKDIGMEVYICARNEQNFIDAECLGYKTLHIDRINSSVFHFDYIFNTVPFNIFSFQDIVHFNGKYFELASAPFGTKKEFFEGKIENYIDCASLPGKFLPVSSAELIAKSVIGYIKERRGGD